MKVSMVSIESTALYEALSESCSHQKSESLCDNMDEEVTEMIAKIQEEDIVQVTYVTPDSPLEERKEEAIAELKKRGQEEQCSMDDSHMKSRNQKRRRRRRRRYADSKATSWKKPAPNTESVSGDVYKSKEPISFSTSFSDKDDKPLKQQHGGQVVSSQGQHQQVPSPQQPPPMVTPSSLTQPQQPGNEALKPGAKPIINNSSPAKSLQHIVIQNAKAIQQASHDTGCDAKKEQGTASQIITEAQKAGKTTLPQVLDPPELPTTQGDLENPVLVIDEQEPSPQQPPPMVTPSSLTQPQQPGNEALQPGAKPIINNSSPAKSLQHIVTKNATAIKQASHDIGCDAKKEQGTASQIITEAQKAGKTTLPQVLDPPELPTTQGDLENTELVIDEQTETLRMDWKRQGRAKKRKKKTLPQVLDPPELPTTQGDLENSKLVIDEQTETLRMDWKRQGRAKKRKRKTLPQVLDPPELPTTQGDLENPELVIDEQTETLRMDRKRQGRAKKRKRPPDTVLKNSFHGSDVKLKITPPPSPENDAKMSMMSTESTGLYEATLPEGQTQQMPQSSYNKVDQEVTKVMAKIQEEDIVQYVYMTPDRPVDSPPDSPLDGTESMGLYEATSPEGCIHQKSQSLCENIDGEVVKVMEEKQEINLYSPLEQQHGRKVVSSQGQHQNVTQNATAIQQASHDTGCDAKKEQSTASQIITEAQKAGKTTLPQVLDPPELPTTQGDLENPVLVIDEQVPSPQQPPPMVTPSSLTQPQQPGNEAPQPGAKPIINNSSPAKSLQHIVIQNATAIQQASHDTGCDAKKEQSTASQIITEAQKAGKTTLPQVLDPPELPTTQGDLENPVLVIDEQVPSPQQPPPMVTPSSLTQPQQPGNEAPQPGAKPIINNSSPAKSLQHIVIQNATAIQQASHDTGCDAKKEQGTASQIITEAQKAGKTTLPQVLDPPELPTTQGDLENPVLVIDEQVPSPQQPPPMVTPSSLTQPQQPGNEAPQPGAKPIINNSSPAKSLQHIVTQNTTAIKQASHDIGCDAKKEQSTASQIITEAQKAGKTTLPQVLDPPELPTTQGDLENPVLVIDEQVPSPQQPPPMVTPSSLTQPQQPANEAPQPGAKPIINNSSPAKSLQHIVIQNATAIQQASHDTGCDAKKEQETASQIITEAQKAGKTTLPQVLDPPELPTTQGDLENPVLVIDEQVPSPQQPPPMVTPSSLTQPQQPGNEAPQPGAKPIINNSSPAKSLQHIVTQNTTAIKQASHDIGCDAKKEQETASQIITEAQKAGKTTLPQVMDPPELPTTQGDLENPVLVIDEQTETLRMDWKRQGRAKKRKRKKLPQVLDPPELPTTQGDLENPVLVIDEQTETLRMDWKRQGRAKKRKKKTLPQVLDPSELPTTQGDLENPVLVIDEQTETLRMDWKRQGRAKKRKKKTLPQVLDPPELPTTQGDLENPVLVIDEQTETLRMDWKRQGRAKKRKKKTLPQVLDPPELPTTQGDLENSKLVIDEQVPSPQQPPPMVTPSSLTQPQQPGNEAPQPGAKPIINNSSPAKSLQHIVIQNAMAIQQASHDTGCDAKKEQGTASQIITEAQKAGKTTLPQVLDPPELPTTQGDLENPVLVIDEQVSSPKQAPPMVTPSSLTQPQQPGNEALQPGAKPIINNSSHAKSLQHIVIQNAMAYQQASHDTGCDAKKEQGTASQIITEAQKAGKTTLPQVLDPPELPTTQGDLENPVLVIDEQTETLRMDWKRQGRAKKRKKKTLPQVLDPPELPTTQGDLDNPVLVIDEQTETLRMDWKRQGRAKKRKRKTLPQVLDPPELPTTQGDLENPELVIDEQTEALRMHWKRQGRAKKRKRKTLPQVLDPPELPITQGDLENSKLVIDEQTETLRMDWKRQGRAKKRKRPPATVLKNEKRNGWDSFDGSDVVIKITPPPSPENDAKVSMVSIESTALNEALSESCSHQKSESSNDNMDELNEMMANIQEEDIVQSTYVTPDSPREERKEEAIAELKKRGQEVQCSMDDSHMKSRNQKRRKRRRRRYADSKATSWKKPAPNTESVSGDVYKSKEPISFSSSFSDKDDKPLKMQQVSLNNTGLYEATLSEGPTHQMSLSLCENIDKEVAGVMGNIQEEEIKTLPSIECVTPDSPLDRPPNSPLDGTESICLYEATLSEDPSNQKSLSLCENIDKEVAEGMANIQEEDIVQYTYVTLDSPLVSPPKSLDGTERTGLYEATLPEGQTHQKSQTSCENIGKEVAEMMTNIQEEDIVQEINVYSPLEKYLEKLRVTRKKYREAKVELHKRWQEERGIMDDGHKNTRTKKRRYRKRKSIQAIKATGSCWKKPDHNNKPLEEYLKEAKVTRKNYIEAMAEYMKKRQEKRCSMENDTIHSPVLLDLGNNAGGATTRSKTAKKATATVIDLEESGNDSHILVLDDTVSSPVHNLSNNAGPVTRSKTVKKATASQEERRHRCTVLNCEAKFSSEDALEQHLNLFQHSPCNPCLKATDCKLALDPLFYMCPDCDTEFKTPEDCSAHMRTERHSPYYPPLSVAGYMCAQCLYMFEDYRACMNHIEAWAHNDIGYPFAEAFAAKGTGVGPVAVIQELAEDIARRCSWIPWHVQCLECTLEVDDADMLRQHALETNNTHILGAYCFSSIADVFAGYKARYSCDKCHKLFSGHLELGAKHNCAKGVVGNICEYNVRFFRNFVKHCALSLIKPMDTGEGKLEVIKPMDTGEGRLRTCPNDRERSKKRKRQRSPRSPMTILGWKERSKKSKASGGEMLTVLSSQKGKPPKVLSKDSDADCIIVGVSGESMAISKSRLQDISSVTSAEIWRRATRNQSTSQGVAGNQSTSQGVAGNQSTSQRAAGNQSISQGVAGNQSASRGATGGSVIQNCLQLLPYVPPPFYQQQFRYVRGVPCLTIGNMPMQPFTPLPVHMQSDPEMSSFNTSRGSYNNDPRSPAYRQMANSSPVHSALENVLISVDNLSCRKNIIFLDLDNWPSFFFRLPRVLPDRTFCWGFYGGGTVWREPQNIIYRKMKSNGQFYLNERCGKTKDATDFAIVLTVLDGLDLLTRTPDKVGKMDASLPSSVAFTILSGDKGFLEVERLMQKSKRKAVVIDPHQQMDETVYARIISVSDT